VKATTPTADPMRVQAACRALFAQLVASGVSHVAVSPGSRSTPLTVAADRTPDLTVSVHLDERSAGFFAMGLARSSRRPVALVCTSGSAAANYLPAVVEAFHSGVPLIVITADRPPELQGRGAPQTIDQTGLYGSHVRWEHQADVIGTEPPEEAARLAVLAVEHSLNPVPGPAHLNCPFREPLEPPVGDPPQVTLLPKPAPARQPEAGDVRTLSALLSLEKGLIVAGPMDLDTRGKAAVSELAAASGWPLMADPASGLRRGPSTIHSPVMACGDHLLAAGMADTHPPDVVLQLGGMPTSRAYRLWLERCEAERVVAVDHTGRFPDPSFAVTDRIAADSGEMAAALAPAAAGAAEQRSNTNWTRLWLDAEAAAAATVASLAASAPFDEPGVAVALCQAMPGGANLVVSNSMPIRDLDAFMPLNQRPLAVYANRGANGIDGQVSTALGIAAGSEAPTLLFTGDLALLHDLAGLVAGVRLEVDLTVVVVDNDGGGIFSFLPITAESDVDHDRLFHTPHGLDLGHAASLAGATLDRVSNRTDLDLALATSVGHPGIHLVHVRTNASTNVGLHRAAATGVAGSLGGMNP
jgi:2-succinyl-5-enolpyruvyl-6-hydroxy-3-cyclohexene-1-carboxylate synthase|tara:strand:+ start:13346 stop:15097 length:1752 start_codon:yes stop_codon:yes gene_type:complete